MSPPGKSVQRDNIGVHVISTAADLLTTSPAFGLSILGANNMLTASFGDKFLLYVCVSHARRNYPQAFLYATVAEPLFNVIVAWGPESANACDGSMRIHRYGATSVLGTSVPAWFFTVSL